MFYLCSVISMEEPSWWQMLLIEVVGENVSTAMGSSLSVLSAHYDG